MVALYFFLKKMMTCFSHSHHSHPLCLPSDRLSTVLRKFSRKKIYVLIRVSRSAPLSALLQ